MSQSIEKRLASLRQQLHHHNDLYYQQATPEISDQAYDALMRELIELEEAHPTLKTPDSPSQRVGGAPIDGFTTITHAVPMMSIDNTYNEADLREFDARVRKALDDAPFSYVLEPKVDGIAASLRYQDAQLVLAATRGDGRTGDDITQNAKTISSIPLRLKHHGKIPPIIEIRGEIFTPNAEFQRVNLARQNENQPTFVNPRNFTAGTLKQLDSRLVATRKLRFVAHGLGQVDPLPTTSYWEWIQLIKRWGLPVGEHTSQAANVDEALQKINEFAQIRGTLAYQTDGIVIKVDSFTQRQHLGATSKAPRWVIAYKYAAEQAQTKILNVRWQVGKSGNLTPVADLEPVFVSGSTVQRVTLHNLDQITRLDPRIGDTVVIEKAGEVIPYLVQVVLEKRPPHTHPLHPPETCPSCGTKTQREEDAPYVRCNNPACPEQLKERLRWFCGRNQMDVGDVGEKLVDQLVDANLVKTFADLYHLTPDHLLTLERMGEKSANNVIEAIKISRSRTLDRLLAALGIRHVGNRVARILAAAFGSLDSLQKASEEELANVPEIGPAIAKSVHEYFHTPAGVHAITALQSAAINPIMQVAPKSTHQPLAGKSIVVTGTFKNYDRKQIEEKITELGGKPSSSVSKKTAFVIAGDSAGSKLQKAKDLKVEVISEDEFQTRIA